jgi:hypothetical protein
MNISQSASWTKEMTMKLLEVMVEVKRTSTASNGKFKKQEWNKIYSAFNSKCGLTYNGAKIQNKYSELKKNTMQSMISATAVASGGIQ